METCVFCPHPIVTDWVELSLRGVEGIHKTSESKCDGIQVKEGQKVHKLCRKNYTRPSSQKSDVLEVTIDSIDESSREIDLRNVCMFCSRPAKLTESRKRGIEVHQVKDGTFESTIRQCIEERNDKWAQVVDERIRNKNLIGATYHQPCSINFRAMKPCPQWESGKKVGRPQDGTRDAAFLKICGYMMDNEGEVFAISDLCDRMDRECDENASSYSRNYFKKKLLEHFGDNIVISQTSGTNDLVLFRYSVEDIISDFYKTKRNLNSQAEKDRIIKLAFKLIRSDILSIPKCKEEYPHPDDLADVKKQSDFVPTMLSDFLVGVTQLKKQDLKVVAIGQAIVQATRPRAVLAPVQIGLGIQMHHHFGSKHLIQTLNKLGFCASYAEVLKFKLCAAISTTDVELQHNANIVGKFVADNVDHDTRTLDGKNTFHGMGIIAAFTPQIKNLKAVKRTDASIEQVRAIGTIPIITYEGDTTADNLTFEKLNELDGCDLQEKIDFLLSVTWGAKRPSWAGFMQSINHGSHSGKSSITILPMIDLNPSDFTCIYSTLQYVEQQAAVHGITPIITFDQPLYLKALLIISNAPANSPLKKIVLLLGGFHTVMSFLGCIGSLMEDMGLQETFETIYAANSVTHMMSGKAFSRAVRGHFIVDNAVNTLLREIVPQVNEERQNDWNAMLSEIDGLYEKVFSGHIQLDEVTTHEILKSAKEIFEQVKQRLSQKSRTAKLWIQYTDMIQLLRSFIRSERTGNWILHLVTLKKMLPYFAAAGHNHYAKCIYLYLQQMLQLVHSHPEVYRIFMNGDFIIRRSDRYWGGIACDLTIEQTLMRNVKSQGGLTRGSGINERNRLIWIQSMPECIEINMAMQQLTELYFETSEQHKDCGASRQARDHEDTQRVLDFLKERNPFTCEDSDLRNICNGMKADGNVNIDESAKIGEKIISSMIGQKVEDYTFKKANSVIKPNSKNALVIDGEIVNIDPQLLFQRLMLITRDMDEVEIRNVFKYELSQRPSALFDELGFMREANNSSLYDTLWKKVGCENTAVFEGRNIILNGRSLIHKIPWEKNETFDVICLKYIKFVAQYGQPTVVFERSHDLTPSIKDEAYLRRTKGIPGKDILFNGSMVLNCKKESFLTNKLNMERFIDMLGKTLHENNCEVVYASGDPISTIAQVAVRGAVLNETVVIGGSIAELAMLCHNFNDESYNIWFQSDEKKSKSKRLWSLQKMNEILGGNVMKSLIFMHAMTGSEGTSHLFGLSTLTALNKFNNVTAFRDISADFLSEKTKISEIVAAGKKAVCILYGGKVSQELDDLRYQRFTEKVKSRTTAVQIQSLPPTEAAVYYHSLRTYYQIQTWLGITNLDPQQFGWELKSNMLRAKTTDLESAPANLLSKIRCSCKGNCDTKRCNCKKFSMKCTPACGECKGMSCLNSMRLIVEEDDEEF